MDPITKQYPELTPYQFASNSPLQGIDLDGLELLKVNSSAYRMKFLGTLPLIKKASTEYIEINVVRVIDDNLPTGYKPVPNVVVGTQGENIYFPPGPSFNIVPEADDESDLESAAEETVQKTERTTKTQGGKTARIFRKTTVTDNIPQKAGKAGAKLTSLQDIIQEGRKIWAGVESFKDMLANVKEEALRNAFYRATNIVDTELSSETNKAYMKKMSAITDVGNFRADLVNYITDGTQPSSFSGDKKNEAYYKSEVLRVGQILMKDYKIEKNKIS